MILILAPQEDYHFKAVEEELLRTGEPYVLFDPSEISHQNFFSCHYGEQIQPHVRAGNTKINLEQVKVVWNRRRPSPLLSPLIDEASHEYIVKETDHWLRCLEELTSHAFWLPKITASERARKKPYQLQLASQVGLKIPDTYIGNDVGEIQEFIERPYKSFCLKALYRAYTYKKHSTSKKISLWLKSKLGPGREEARRLLKQGAELLSVGSKKLSRSYLQDNLRQLAYCPVILQEYIEKQFELRITIVGTQLFPCAIYSQESEKAMDDWREEDSRKLRHEAFELPEKIRYQLLELTRRLNLQFGCVDMIVTPEGEFVFLEINPNGQWLWVQEMVGFPIARAITDLMLGNA